MSNKEYNFQKLTPIDNADIGIYENAINYAFKHSDIKNIAISGTYSAGKSSILESYKRKHKDLKFIHISLSHFNGIDYEEDTDLSKKESILEGKILNQLIHQIPAEKIPQTNFRIKRNVETKRKLNATLLIMIFIYLILHIKFFKEWGNYVSSLSEGLLKSILKISTNQYSFFTSGLIVAIISGIFLYKVLTIQINKNIFRKLKLQGNEIELFQESDESYFDRYLNEVLYIFDNVEVDAIVFEDIDRFNVIRIFERLREINVLINVKCEKKLRFFYLLRDDIFVSKDRTKFFDYIIPIIPIVDGSNSYDEFVELLKNDNLYKKFKKGFLQGISLYIDDMRLLKNIYNEFIIYYDKLKGIELDCNKILAIITYKNLFPRDFSNLQFNKGFVYALFENKNRFILEEINNLNTKINEKNKDITLCNNEILKSLQELDYLKERMKQKYDYGRIRQEEYNKWCKEEYPTRKKFINDRDVNLKRELNALEKERDYIQHKQLNQIITRENIEKIFKITSLNEIGEEERFEEIKSSNYFDLLKYLIRNGYIDETYSDYMTYFKETSLSRVDKIFLRSITDKKSKEYTYSLKNPSLVIEKLCDNDFEQEEILNFDLLEYLLKTSEQHSQYLNIFIHQLKDTENFEFISKYMNEKREIIQLIILLNKQWQSMFAQALVEKALSVEQLQTYSINSLYFSDDDDLKNINRDGYFSDYISNSSDYLNIENPRIEKLISTFKLLDISFKSINYDLSNKELFRKVYENSLYDMSFENICLMLRKVYLIEDDIIHKNYTMVLQNPESSLNMYVREDFDKYIDIIINNCEGEITDDENVALLIINDETLNLEKRKNYIQLLKTYIKDITYVNEKELKDALLNNKLVICSEENIIEYFKENKLNSVLVEFINKDTGELNFSKMEDDYGKEIKDEFFNKVVTCKEISNKKYKEILETLNSCYPKFNIKNISIDKCNILNDIGVIKMNLETLVFIRENYSAIVMPFINRNLDEYVDIMDSSYLKINEVLDILYWDCNEEKKIKLLSLTNEPISIINNGYSRNINNYILKNNLDTEEIYELINSYDNSDSLNLDKASICKLAIETVDYVIEEKDSISMILVHDMLHSNDMDINYKYKLFISIMFRLTIEECQEYFKLLELFEFEKLFKPRSRPKIETSNINEEILQALKEREWIEGFERNSEEEGFYKIIKNRDMLIYE